jgi:hypothetical protein
MSLLRPSLLGAKTLSRSLSVWPYLLLATWTVLIRFQEPEFFAHQGVPFFWPSQLAMTLLVIGLLPLAWRLTQGYDAAIWTLRSAHSVSRAVLSIWLAVVGYGGLLVVSTLVFSALAAPITSWSSDVTLYRILHQWGSLAPALLDAVAFLFVTASLAPALALTPWSTSTVVFVWLPILAGAMQWFGPWEFSEPAGAPTVLSGILSTLLATLGGLAVSLAHTHHRLRH